MAYRKVYILYPFSILFGIITDIRNMLYDKGWIRSEKFSLPVICVGNLAAGGTGKTPHTEYLAGLLKEESEIAVLSRGYKRKSKGFRYVTPSSTVSESGDEPLQIACRFPGIRVAVDSDRVNGIRRLIADNPGTKVILMDDGFQHRRVRPGLSIILTDIGRPFTRDHLLPFGRLRERRSNIKRSDIVIVTKSPVEITSSEIEELTKELQGSRLQKVFFTTVNYGLPLPVFREAGQTFSMPEEADEKRSGAVLVTGIASPAPLRKHIDSKFAEVRHLSFPDHHTFTARDISRIASSLDELVSELKYVITTEKDAIRLREFSNIAQPIKKVLYYIPVTLSFLNGAGPEFDNLIKEYVRKNYGNG